MSKSKIYAAKKPGMPGFAACFFFEPGDEKDLAKAVNQWASAGYEFVGSVSQSRWDRGASAFLAARRKAQEAKAQP